MSSLWGLTKIVVEGEKAKEVYDLLCRAKEECGREECGYRSEIVCAGNGQYRFAFGLDRIVKYESEDEIFGPSTVTEVVRPDVFMLLPDPDDEDLRYVTQFGKIEFEYGDSVLRVSEDTYGDEGAMLPFLVEYLGEEYDGLYYHISSEADYIGETNDQEGKYFNLDEYEQELYGSQS
jgi:hypothetical protein